MELLSVFAILVFVVFNTIAMQHIGIDIIEIPRIKKALDEWGEKFLRRVYTGREIELYQNQTPSLAARFAAKEAVMKALNTANRGISFWASCRAVPYSVMNGLPSASLIRVKTQWP